MIHDGFIQPIHHVKPFQMITLNSLEIRNSSWSKFRIFITHVGHFRSCAVFRDWRLVFRKLPFPIPKLLECGTCWWLDLVHILLDHRFLVVIVWILWCNSGSVLDDLVCSTDPHFVEPQNYLFICRATKNLRKSMPEDGLCGNCGEYLGRCYWRNPQFLWGKFLMVRGIDWWDIDECVIQGRSRTPPAKMEIFFSINSEKVSMIWELFDEPCLVFKKRDTARAVFASWNWDVFKENTSEIKHGLCWGEI